ncbi:MAG TPA: hypothetical protein VMJ10_04305 [Kofleriaceae bacterium]|nr:hypothetical protein [Kofleriaceae bacterium]
MSGRAAWFVIALAACGHVDFDDQNAPGSVAFDAWSSTASTEVDGLGWTHTVQAGDVELVVFVATRSDTVGAPAVSSITYGAASLGKLGAACPNCTSSGLNNYELWALARPAPGTAAIAVTLASQAQGASGLAGAYASDAPVAPDPIASNSGDSTLPNLSWTPPAGARFAIAGAMNQAGYVMALVPGSDQIARSDTVCDDTNWEGQAFADELAVGDGAQLSFAWEIGSGSGANCNTVMQSHPWIAIGATFR